MSLLFRTALLSFLALLPLSSYADLPAITSFSASSSYVSFGHDTLLSWSVSGGQYGQDIWFSCAPGVTIKVTGGANVPCDTYQQVGIGGSSTSESFSIVNVSGSTQTIHARLIPYDATRVRNEAGASETYLSVGTLPQPFFDFHVSTTSVVSGDSVTLSWTGNSLSGAMIQFECVNDVTLTLLSPSQTGNLPCGTLAYTTDLPGTGSITVKATNTSLSKRPVSVRVFPALGFGLYDGTHSMSVSFSVLAKTLPLPSAVTSFSAFPTQVGSGSSVTFSWDSTNASGVNLQFQCDSEVSVFGVDAPATTSTKLLCNVPAFTTSLQGTGSTTVTFVNRDTASHLLLAFALPQTSDGIYHGTGAKVLSITVGRFGAGTVPSTVTTAQVQPQTTVLPVVTTEGEKKIVRDVVFSIPLFKGSRGVQVAALQKFLAQDSALYPEQIVSGYFGALTELALKRFQERYGIAKSGDSGYGFVGPKTRGKLNSLESF